MIVGNTASAPPGLQAQFCTRPIPIRVDWCSRRLAPCAFCAVLTPRLFIRDPDFPGASMVSLACSQERVSSPLSATRLGIAPTFLASGEAVPRIRPVLTGATGSGWGQPTLVGRLDCKRGKGRFVRSTRRSLSILRPVGTHPFESATRRPPGSGLISRCRSKQDGQYTWRDGDRTMTVLLQPDLTLTRESETRPLGNAAVNGLRSDAVVNGSVNAAVMRQAPPTGPCSGRNPTP